MVIVDTEIVVRLADSWAAMGWTDMPPHNNALAHSATIAKMQRRKNLAGKKLIGPDFPDLLQSRIETFALSPGFIVIPAHVNLQKEASG